MRGDNICFACENGFHNRCEHEFHNKGRYWNCACDCKGEEIDSHSDCEDHPCADCQADAIERVEVWK